jgi:mycothiol system anti-sigma-R factor
MECRQVLDRLSPFLDDELDPVASREVSQHLESCVSCAAALDRQRKLSESLKQNLEDHRAPDLLRARVMRDLRAAGRGVDAAPRLAAQPWRWLSAVAPVAAAAAVVALIGGTWMMNSFSRGRAEDAAVREAVSGHVRSLMANHLTDVASTDQHTVKPWFSGKLDFSPPVTDFAAADYPLIGGRLDYLQGHPVAALVYMHRKHVINVFVWPQAGAADGITPAVTQQGYHAIHGTHSGMTFWVVSDLNSAELATFAQMLAAPSAPPGAAR